MTRFARKNRHPAMAPTQRGTLQLVESNLGGHKKTALEGGWFMRLIF
jgi:hypothetical protein